MSASMPAPQQTDYQPQPQQPNINDYTANEIKVASLIDGSNPLVQQAMARARQSFASRGLLNSSMADEAAQEAAISKALDIIAPDTSAYYTDLRDSKQFGYDKSLAELGYAQQDKMADKQFGYDKSLAEMSYANQDARDSRQFDYSKALAELGYAQQDKMADKQFDYNKALEELSYLQQDKRDDKQFANSRTLADLNYAYQDRRDDKQFENSRTLAGMNYAYQDGRDAREFENNRTLAAMNYDYQNKRDDKQLENSRTLADLNYANQDKMARLNNDLSLANEQSLYNMKVGDTTHTNYLTMIDRIQSDATRQVQQINSSSMPYDEKVKAINSIQDQSRASIANSNELFKTMNGWQSEWAVAADSYGWNVASS
jgi:hypothetical protein